MKTFGITRVLTITAILASLQTGAYCQQTNDFFGANNAIPGTGAATNALNNAAGDASNFKPGDYTEDEKRMQHKYRDSLKHAKGLISKGKSMMDSGQKDHNDKIFKKGKIFKEIGEKQLTELTANNPFNTPGLETEGEPVPPPKKSRFGFLKKGPKQAKVEDKADAKADSQNPTDQK